MAFDLNTAKPVEPVGFDPNTAVPVARERPAKREDKDPASAKNIAGAAFEPLLALGSGTVAYPLGLLSALGAHWMELAGFETSGPEANRQAMMEALTYQPRTPTGQKVTEMLTDVLTLGGSIPRVAEWTGEKAGGGHYGAVTEELLNLAPGVSGAGMVPKGHLFPRAVREKAAYPITATSDISKRAGRYIENALMSRLSDKVMDRMIGETLNQITGAKTQPVIEALTRAEPGVTASQAAVPARSRPMSALQKLGEEIMPDEYGDLFDAQSIQRRADIQESIARTPEELAREKDLLDADAGEAYELSRNNIVTSLNESAFSSDKLSKLVDRPSIQAAIKEAELGARETGTYWPKSPDEPFTVGNLQRIKREVAETIAAEQKAGTMGPTKKRERTGTVNQFTDWLRRQSPEFAKAEDMYAERMQPISQMRYGQEVMRKMDDLLYETKERPRQFITAKEEGEKIVKKLTGREIPAKDILTDDQWKTMENVEGQYIRDAELAKMSAKGLKKVNKQLGEVFNLPTFGILDRAMVIINTLIRRIEGINTEAALNRIAELGLNPREMARLMRAASPEEKAFINQYMNAKSKSAVASIIAAQQETEEDAL